MGGRWTQLIQDFVHLVLWIGSYQLPGVVDPLMHVHDLLQLQCDLRWADQCFFTELIDLKVVLWLLDQQNGPEELDKRLVSVVQESGQRHGLVRVDV